MTAPSVNISVSASVSQMVETPTPEVQRKRTWAEIDSMDSECNINICTFIFGILIDLLQSILYLNTTVVCGPEACLARKLSS